MSEVEAIQELTERMPVDTRTEELITQVDDFERFLAEMKITVEKRQILLHREDIKPQIVYYNY